MSSLGGQTCCHKWISLWLVMNYIASISFGKDSLAMLLLLLEKKYPINEIIFYDTRNGVSSCL